MREYGIGQSQPRSEDFRLVRGAGNYTDDFVFPGQTYLYVVRSPHAAADIRRIDVAEAKALPGVLAVLTGADVVANGLGTFPCRVKRQRRDGRPNFEPPYRALAVDHVRHVGDAVVAVIAESYAVAKDAGERVAIDYDPLPSVTATANAAKPGAPAVWDETPDNICFLLEIGCVGALPAIMNAIDDALKPLGVYFHDMPATPERLWRCIRDAKLGKRAAAP